MITKYLTRIFRGFKVVKTKTNEGPLPSMTKYSLQSDQDQPLSFWNDIPIDIKDDTMNIVVEIPKQLHGKFEVKKHLANHPIMQDTRKNFFSQQLQRRFYNQFPFFNYGYIPQTWEQTIVKNSQGLFGDDDPIDICDLTQKPMTPGQIFRGKILGCFCLIDQGEVDWKVLVMDQKECLQKKVNSVEDIDPRLIKSMKQWFKVVKIHDGKKPNIIAYNQKTFSKEQTIQIIKQTRKDWLNLMRSDNQQIVKKRNQHTITNRQKYLHITE